MPKWVTPALVLEVAVAVLAIVAKHQAGRRLARS